MLDGGGVYPGGVYPGGWISSGGNGMRLELLTVRSSFLWLAEGACWLSEGKELGGL